MTPSRLFKIPKSTNFKPRLCSSSDLSNVFVGFMDVRGGSKGRVSLVGKCRLSVRYSAALIGGLSGPPSLLQLRSSAGSFSHLSKSLCIM